MSGGLDPYLLREGLRDILAARPSFRLTQVTQLEDSLRDFRPVFDVSPMMMV
jgi:hypothetical protein